MIELQGVVKRYGDHAAICGIDLVCDTGKTQALIGPSGCGKSTLIRMMVGLAEPDAGSVRIDGQPLTATNVAQLRRRIGYVIQEGGLFPHLTARENAALNGLADRFSVCEPDELPPRPFELVVANLEAPVLLDNAERMASYAASGTRLLVTGFLDERRDEIRARFTALGFREQNALSEAGWSLLDNGCWGSSPCFITNAAIWFCVSGSVMPSTSVQISSLASNAASIFSVRQFMPGLMAWNVPRR